MNSDTISHIVKGLKNKYKECDPFELCKSLNIIIGMVPMGTHDGSCKGFFISCGRKKMITINSELQPALQRIIAAHELGHAALHGDIDAAGRHAGKLPAAFGSLLQSPCKGCGCRTRGDLCAQRWVHDSVDALPAHGGYGSSEGFCRRGCGDPA